nr:hypothetical protein [Bacteroidota bacterium]
MRFFDSYIDEASPIRKDKLLLTQSQRASIMKKYGASNRKIATELMEKSDGILFSDSTEIKASTRKYSFEPEDSIPLIFDILRRQYREIKYLKQRMNEMLAEKKEKEG